MVEDRFIRIGISLKMNVLLVVYCEKHSKIIRIDAITLNDLKNEADRMGLPYQTLINSILHRFVTGQLVDKLNKTG
jgi:predicted DNA binding CopG/RHH family protein